ncbi:cop-coated vesicle membrane protein p24 precursor [Novymonas esmeraldas]|uniref:Cop-coated vesicle membrane protein p24 n=1 Tax=Novymonas esmeraldas TaxID=1808958 RepID=A0AAW0F1V0_9TRYP
MTLPLSRQSLTTVVVVVLVLLASAVAVHPARAGDGGLAVQVAPGQTNCFYEDVPTIGMKVFLHYIVSSGGALDIDCKIVAPDNSVVWDVERETENRILFKSRNQGAYRFCFSNRMSTLTSKVVSFSVTLGDGSGADTARSKGSNSDSLHRSIMRLQQGLREIEELQQVLRDRERDHRATTEVANTRVLVFCLLEIVFIAGMGVGSVVYLRRMFVTKRMV